MVKCHAVVTKGSFTPDAVPYSATQHHTALQRNAPHLM